MQLTRRIPDSFTTFSTNFSSRLRIRFSSWNTNPSYNARLLGLPAGSTESMPLHRRAARGRPGARPVPSFRETDVVCGAGTHTSRRQKLSALQCKGPPRQRRATRRRTNRYHAKFTRAERARRREKLAAKPQSAAEQFRHCCRSIVKSYGNGVRR